MNVMHNRKILFVKDGTIFSKADSDKVTMSVCTINKDGSIYVPDYGNSTSAVIDGKLNYNYLRYLNTPFHDFIKRYDLDVNNLNLAAIHAKTGHDYIIKSIAVGCNNGDEESLNIVYTDYDGDVTYVREIREFFDKFRINNVRWEEFAF